jgi:hypothetical protein
MDCDTFRNQHLELLDQTLDELTLVQAELHRATCPTCAQLDARLRRGLMVARSLPEIGVSAGFGSRLAARIAEERVHAVVRTRRRGMMGAAVVCLLAVAALATRSTRADDERRFVGLGTDPTAVAVVGSSSANRLVQGRIDPAFPHDSDEVFAATPVVSAIPMGLPMGGEPLPTMLQATPVLATDVAIATSFDR